MRNLWIGLGVSLLPAALFVVPGADTVVLVVALAVFVVGLAQQIRAGVAAVRSGRNPVRPVLDATVCYWVGASVGSTLGWTVVLAAEFAFPVEGGVALGLRDLLGLWTVAGVCAAVVAAVTGAWRAASRPA